MHYYQHHIGDFRAGCFNMDRMERWIYRDMIEVYYDREQALPDDVEKVCALLGVRAEQEKLIVASLLQLKFTRTSDGWIHERCDEEIARYHKGSEKASAAGKASAAKRALSKVEQKPNDRSTAVQRPFNDRSTSVQQELIDCSTKINDPSTNQQPITNNQEPKKVKSNVEPDGPTARVFRYWQQVMGKTRTPLDAKRIRSISGRLKDGYTVEQLCQAVDGCRADPFSMGKNDRNAPFNDIELICRDGSKVDRFIAVAARPVGSMDARMQHQIDELNNWMAEEE